MSSAIFPILSITKPLLAYQTFLFMSELSIFQQWLSATPQVLWQQSLTLSLDSKFDIFSTYNHFKCHGVWGHPNTVYVKKLQSNFGVKIRHLALMTQNTSWSKHSHSVLFSWIRFHGLSWIKAHGHNHLNWLHVYFVCWYFIFLKIWLINANKS